MILKILPDTYFCCHNDCSTSSNTFWFNPLLLFGQVLAESLIWMGKTIDEFGVSVLNVKSLIEWLKVSTVDGSEELEHLQAGSECDISHEVNRPGELDFVQIRSFVMNKTITAPNEEQLLSHIFVFDSFIPAYDTLACGHSALQMMRSLLMF